MTLEKLINQYNRDPTKYQELVDYLISENTSLKMEVKRLDSELDSLNFWICDLLNGEPT